MNTPHDDFSRARFWGNAVHFYEQPADESVDADDEDDLDEEPMDLALQLSVTPGRIGGRTGGTVGGWGIFVGARDAQDLPRVAARVRERTPLSLDPYIVEIVQLPPGKDNYFDPGCWVLARKAIYPGDPTMRIDALLDDERVSVYARIRSQSYTDEALRELLDDPELCIDVVGPAAYRLDVGTSGNVGFALDPREPQPRIFGWLEARSSGDPYTLRLVEWSGEGVLTAEAAANAPTLAQATLIPPPEKENEKGVLLETTFEGRRYAFRASFGAFSQRAAAYIRL
ncbi:hypothetical protein LZC95_30355 [Pendulispora brunnea]|uniref:Uncharacterized protein n=1 Tax=Pendulispora brunnea TaxID=2905690 RepID=A0ABZ2K1X1_9BACT